MPTANAYKGYSQDTPETADSPAARDEERTLFALIEEAMTPDGQSVPSPRRSRPPKALQEGPGPIVGAGTSSRGHVVALVRRRVGSAGRAAHGQLGHL